MSKRFKINIALLCALCILWGTLCGFSEVLEGETAPDAAYVEVPVYVDGILTTSGYIVGGRTYISLSAFSSALKMSCELKTPAAGMALCAVLGGLEFSVSADGSYMTSNGRYFYLADGLCLLGGENCLPGAELAKLFGAQVQWDVATASVDIDTTHRQDLQSGDVFYGEEDLKWLSHIINAESGNQTLEGMMGVGNVVINRVADPTCPDTIYDVIFDTRYGVQFSPVETGGIYAEPNEQSIIAAKLCLEGYNTVGESLYFVNPATGSTRWFRETRTFVSTIGDHDFYA
ncbi:MAG: cell wall hydrolase [Oscillospiraceae bacterium]